MNLDATRSTEETTVTVDLSTSTDALDVTLEWDAHGGLEEPIEASMATHLYETLLDYANLGGTLDARGDLAHHVIEDAAITLGKALKKRARDEPIQRYADRAVPMDDALVHVALDAGGRPHYESDLHETSLVFDHVLRSVSMNAAATLHVRVLRGRDDHHVVEAAMKALGLALQEAFEPAKRVQSTKGQVQSRVGGDEA